MNCKAKGSRRERQTMTLLKRQGYYASRTAASLGAYDVVAVSPAEVLLIQVASKGSRTPEKVNRLKALPCPLCVRKLIYIWEDYVGNPVVKNAE